MLGVKSVVFAMTIRGARCADHVWPARHRWQWSPPRSTTGGKVLGKKNEVSGPTINRRGASRLQRERSTTPGRDIVTDAITALAAAGRVTAKGADRRRSQIKS